MNSKSTVLLVLLACAAGAWWWKGDEWAAQLKLGAKPRTGADSPSLAAVESAFTPGAITRIELPGAAGEAFVLEKADTPAGWKLPGNWPLRPQEAGELAALFTNLRTRFQPIPVTADADLTRYGLAPGQKPLVVKVTAGNTTHTLRFGESPVNPDEPAFTRPAFVRIDDNPEVLRLGPDVLPVLRRSADSYRKRQLFPDADRVKLAVGAGPASPFGPPPAAGGVTTATLLGDKVKGVAVRGPGGEVSIYGLKVPVADGAFELKRVGPMPAPVAAEKGADPAVTPDRIAGAWELASPIRDRVDPAKLQKLLAAVPDLWVEDFANNTDQLFALADFLAAPTAPGLAAVGVAVAAETGKESWFLKRTGLVAPERTLTITPAAGDDLVIQFGAVAKVQEKDETVNTPAMPGRPPMPITRKVPEEYRFARLANNPQVFVVKADKLADLFAKIGELKDARVARFAPDDVQELVVTMKGRPPVKLTRKAGNPKAADAADRTDRWYIDHQPNPMLADAGKVDELLGQLAGLQAAGADVVVGGDPKAFDLDPAGTTVALTVREKRPDDQPRAPEQRFTLLVGKPDATTKKLPVQVAGWPRISLVGNESGPDPKATLVSLIERPPIAYRSRKLFDTAESKLESVRVAAEGPFAVADLPLPAGGTAWKLTEPFAADTDPTKTGPFAAVLSGLEAAEFITDSPTPEELTKYGLDKPKQTATLTFAGPNGRTRKLELGAAREGKPEVFARLDGGGVFAVNQSVADQLGKGAIELLPLQVWSVPLEKLTSVEVVRGGETGNETYTLTKDGTNWKLTGPFTAAVPFLSAQPTLGPLVTLQAVKYHALAAANPAEFGFDKPVLRVKLTYTADKDATATKTLVVGNPTPDGQGRYARLENAPNTAVFVVAQPVATVAVTPALDLLDRRLLFLPDPGRITKVQLAGAKPDQTLTLTKDDKGMWKAEGAAFGVDSPAIDQLLAAFARLPVRKLAAYGENVKWADYGLDTPEATVTVTLAGDKPVSHAVKLGKADPAGGRYARVDDGPAVAVLDPVGSAALAKSRLDFVDRTLLSFDPATLVGFSRTKGKEELELAPAAAAGWDIVKPAKHKADPALMEELAEALGKLRAERVAAFGGKDTLKEFGLDDPAATITLAAGTTAKVLKIGNPVDPAKPEGDRFATVDGPGAEAVVGVLPAAISKKLLAPPVGFRDRTLAKFVDADKLVLERGDRTVTFAKVNGTWKVTAPVAADAEQLDLDEFVNALAKLRADEAVAEKPEDLKPFGLDKPEAKWTVSEGGKDVLVLLVGKKEQGGPRVFVMPEKGELVGLLDAPLTAKVLGEYRKRKAWDGVDAAQVDAVEIDRGGAKFVLAKAGTMWVDPAKPDDKIATGAVNELLGTLAGLRAERYAADADADPKLFGLDKPEVTITVTPRDGAKRVLQIGAAVGVTDGKQRYARVDDKGRTDVIVLTEADTTRLTRDRGVYVEKK